MPKISVIVPVYNGEKYLKKCIKSIDNQILKDVEIIAVDDCSTDKSLETLYKLKDSCKVKMTILKQDTNKRAGAARNVGLDHADCQFVKFLDQDDYLDIDVLEKMYQIARLSKVKLVRGNTQTVIGGIKIGDTCSWSNIKNHKTVDVNKDKKYIITESPMLGNKIISRDLIDDIRFPENIGWDDLAITPALLAKAGKIFHLNEPVINYRASANMTTIKDFIKKTPNILDIVDSLDYLDDLMKSLELDEEYEFELKSLNILHILYRVENAMNWVNLSKKNKRIVVTSLISLLYSKYPRWRNNPMIDEYKDANILFKYDMDRLNSFMDYRYLSNNPETAKENINKVLRK